MYEMHTIQVLKNVNGFRHMCQNFRWLHTTLAYRGEQKKPKRKVTETTELITLVDSTNKILGIKSKDDSEKLARKHHMLLEKVKDHTLGNTYPVYKLISGAEIVKRGETEKGASKSRDIKKISISNRITDHDLEVKVKMMRRLLARNCEIHVAITGTQDEAGSMVVVATAFFNMGNYELTGTVQEMLMLHTGIQEGLYKKISEHFQTEARLLDKRIQESALKFIVIPPKVNKEDKTKQTNNIVDPTVEQRKPS